MENKKSKTSNGIFTGLFCALAGIAVGVGGKLIFDELNKDEKVEKEEMLNDKYSKPRDYSQVDKLETAPETTLNDESIEYESFICPITQELMRDPVITPKGISFERRAIVNWLSRNNLCPITKSNLKEDDLITNYALKSTIQEYVKRMDKNQNSN
jgi:hypothetical protein